ncbi:hypothetical protein CFP71_36980 [Amycolatopsis thailandensis]|uniref:Uncharacterized protein n=1 Tax=Amycolatopsis thailandensis TaxID=589330 RepID=A0A229RIP4_9PSEU|nr:hypothetical protein CFP71_36980 [Amycolatopsis thailandensis]
MACCVARPHVGLGCRESHFRDIRCSESGFRDTSGPPSPHDHRKPRGEGDFPLMRRGESPLHPGRHSHGPDTRQDTFALPLK